MTWQPIETAPRDRFIDSFNAYNGERRVTRWDENHWGLDCKWAGWDGNWGNTPTHWMPMPEPPTGPDQAAARFTEPQSRPHGP